MRDYSLPPPRLGFSGEDQDPLWLGVKPVRLERAGVEVISGYSKGVLESYVRRRLPSGLEPSAGRAYFRKLVHLFMQQVNNFY